MRPPGVNHNKLTFLLIDSPIFANCMTYELEITLIDRKHNAFCFQKQSTVFIHESHLRPYMKNRKYNSLVRQVHLYGCEL